MQGMLSTASPIPTGSPGRGLADRPAFGRAATPFHGIERPARQAAPPAAAPVVSRHVPHSLN